MIPQTLLDYIRKQRNAGYTDQQIRYVLVKYGYSEQQIDEAFHHISPKEIRHTIHLSKATIFVILGIVVFLVIGSLIAFNLFKVEEKTLLDISLEPVRTTAKPGENIQVVAEIKNLGSSKRYDINVRFDVLDTNNNIITFKEETKAVETSTSYQTSIPIPEKTKSGSYRLRGIAFYEGKTASAVIPVYVEEKMTASCDDNIKNQNEEGIDCGGPCEPCTSCFNNIQDGDEEGVDCGGNCKECPECPDSCDDKKDCTKDFCSKETGYICKNEIIPNCCGNLQCETGENSDNCLEDCPKTEADIFAGLTIWESIEKINNIAKTNPTLAQQYCNQIEQQTFKDQCLLDVAETAKNQLICDGIFDDRYKDDCYSNVAKAKKDATICQLILKSSRRDSCLMNFVIDFKDYSVCEQITNQYLKQSCESLRDLGQQQ